MALHCASRCSLDVFGHCRRQHSLDGLSVVEIDLIALPDADWGAYEQHGRRKEDLADQYKQEAEPSLMSPSAGGRHKGSRFKSLT